MLACPYRVHGVGCNTVDVHAGYGTWMHGHPCMGYDRPGAMQCMHTTVTYMMRALQKAWCRWFGVNLCLMCDVFVLGVRASIACARSGRCRWAGSPSEVQRWPSMAVCQSWCILGTALQLLEPVSIQHLAVNNALPSIMKGGGEFSDGHRQAPTAAQPRRSAWGRRVGVIFPNEGTWLYGKAQYTKPVSACRCMALDEYSFGRC